ncbi:PRTRC system protein A [Sphingobium sp. Leaf26]|uniref:PRTRC system protein A n=1 Tax=Sphingobium sp. Leaf26 TaxID=1735693 RepID=UPI0006FDA83B|nr:PRTRC system protein A [Sphingobium sp. Leaf26]KQN09840.1 PRTRC system protein A [Sphingobium sp. Leaf26]
MIDLADDATAAAVLAQVPCYPVPPSGRSPALDALRDARVGQGLAIGQAGVMLILRRPWLALDTYLTPPPSGYLPYGKGDQERAELRCGLIPHVFLEVVLRHLRAALPNEAAAFVTWNEKTRAFAVEFPEIDEATPSRLVYRTPVLPADWHIVCDIHSHGTGPAFFSATDNADDAHATKISLVFGHLDQSGHEDMASRLCAAGMFLPIPRSPFQGDHHAA